MTENERRNEIHRLLKRELGDPDRFWDTIRWAIDIAREEVREAGGVDYDDSDLGDLTRVYREIFCITDFVECEQQVG